MQNAVPVYDKRGGFLSSLARGFFGLLITVVICAAGIGLYGLNIADRRAGDLLELTESVAKVLPEWRESLPPALADAIDDRRAPEYRDQLEVSVRPADRDANDRHERVVVEVANRGDQTVSLLAGRIVLTSEDGTPIREEATYVATPLTIEDEWRGPLLPGETRRFTVDLHCRGKQATGASLEITDLRVWRGPQPQLAQPEQQLSAAN